MFKCFQLNIGDFFDQYNERNFEPFSRYSRYEREVRDTLSSYIKDGKSIDAETLQNDWFPEVDADIFLSHSHADEKDAIRLAKMLWDQFGLKTFIDSAVWGYSADLLKEINDKFCKIEGMDRTYNHEYCQQSAAHVHMMLSVALQKMIDKTECLLFFDTDNSRQQVVQQEKTYSPWIYSEIEATHRMRKVVPERLEDKILRKDSGDALNEDFSMEKFVSVLYPANLDHMLELDSEKLEDWLKCGKRKGEALDYLYSLSDVNLG